MEELGKEVELPKDKSTKLTKKEEFGTTIAQILLRKENLEPYGFNEYPKLTMVVAEDKEKFQEGIVRLVFEESEGVERSYLVHMDLFISISQSVYAKTNSDIAKREYNKRRNAKIWGFFKTLMYRVQHKFQK